MAKNNWGDAVPPVEPVEGAAATTDAPAPAPAPEAEVSPAKVEIDTSKYPSHWCFSEAVFADGIPRVKMWRDPYGDAPHSAEVHPDEVSAWSQMGWNIGELPPKE